MIQARVKSYFATLAEKTSQASATDRQGNALDLADALDWAMTTAVKTHADGNKLIFIGNGGSAAISSHMATDFSKNGGIRALAMNDASALTCLGNDLGYDQVFAKQIEMHARLGDMLIAISSSGRSQNILNAVETARAGQCQVLTLSGFDHDNPLRELGDMNLYISSHEYGFVEVSHLALCHATLDLAMGWGEKNSDAAAE